MPEYDLQRAGPHDQGCHTRDLRNIAQKAEACLQNTGIADISYWGPEAEFYIFDDVRYDQSAQAGYYYIDSVEGVWNTGRQEGPNPVVYRQNGHHFGRPVGTT